MYLLTSLTCSLYWLCRVFPAARGLSSAGEDRACLLPCAGLMRLHVAEHGLSVHGLSQRWLVGSVITALGLWSTGSIVVVRVLSFSRAVGSSQTRDQFCVPFIGRWVLCH